jgi:hypothetical protein
MAANRGGASTVGSNAEGQVLRNRQMEADYLAERADYVRQEIRRVERALVEPTEYK